MRLVVINGIDTAPFSLRVTQLKAPRGLRRGDGRNTRFVPANPGVDDGRSRRFNRFGQFSDFRQRAAVVDQIEHRQTVNDNEIVVSALAHRLNHLYGETHAPGIIAAPLVVALVGARGEKFVNQIALRAHHFDAVISRFARQLGAVGKIIDQRQDLIVAQFMGVKRLIGACSAEGATSAGW